MPPLFFASRSWNGKHHPPSLSGVASHNRMRCLLGEGGAWSVYSVLACRTCAFETNCISPISRIMCNERRLQVASSTSAASLCAGDSGGMMPFDEKRSRERTKYGSHLVLWLAIEYLTAKSLESRSRPLDSLGFLTNQRQDAKPSKPATSRIFLIIPWQQLVWSVRRTYLQ